jgi:hypothetical protein
MQSNSKLDPKVEQVSDLAAAEREVEAYLNGLGKAGGGPDAHVPFAIDRQGVEAAFRKWLGTLSLVPGDLTTAAELGTLKQIYVPFWLVNSMTYSRYNGERGEEYQDTEYQTDANGNSTSRQVTKIAWNYADGEVKHNFENVVLCAGSGLSAEQTNLLTPKNAANAQPYRAPGADVTVQRSAFDPRAAFNKARTSMEASIKKLVEKDIGGKQQKVNKVETRHVGVSMRQLLVPAWQGTYKYKGKDYPIFLHGATGEATGEHPLSAGKVLLVVLIFFAIVAAIAAAVYFFVIKPGMQMTEAPAAQPALVCSLAPTVASRPHRLPIDHARLAGTEFLARQAPLDFRPDEGHSVSGGSFQLVGQFCHRT